jgi:hypothetical protein
MITLEKLTEFTQEDLRYKSSIKVISYKIVGNWIDLQFDSGKGEVVSVDRFNNWVNDKREKKISQLLD